MDETSKTRNLWTASERQLLEGRGIDIGCGPDRVTPEALGFDRAQGDANHISRYFAEQFDFVFSSHCLEHMDDPWQAILEWWNLVKPGGHLFVLVPDEDLYEQGVFPSRWNLDHKATFTLSKRESWSPVSINVIDLVKSLPSHELISVQLQDHAYDRSLLRHGPVHIPRVVRVLRGIARQLARLPGIRRRWIERLFARFDAVDQTMRKGVLAQIQFIVRKLPAPDSFQYHCPR
jgi:SAM-dependent methyltransferase